MGRQRWFAAPRLLAGAVVVGALLGGVVGFVIGVRVHVQTSPFAFGEGAVIGAFAGLLLGAAAVVLLGAAALVRRALTR